MTATYSHMYCYAVLARTWPCMTVSKSSSAAHRPFAKSEFIR